MKWTLDVSYPISHGSYSGTLFNIQNYSFYNPTIFAFFVKGKIGVERKNTRKEISKKLGKGLLSAN